jgi:hypothetical protein
MKISPGEKYVFYARVGPKEANVDVSAYMHIGDLIKIIKEHLKI